MGRSPLQSLTNIPKDWRNVSVKHNEDDFYAYIAQVLGYDRASAETIISQSARQYAERFSKPVTGVGELPQGTAWDYVDAYRRVWGGGGAGGRSNIPTTGEDEQMVMSEFQARHAPTARAMRVQASRQYEGELRPGELVYGDLAFPTSALTSAPGVVSANDALWMGTGVKRDESGEWVPDPSKLVKHMQNMYQQQDLVFFTGLGEPGRSPLRAEGPFSQNKDGQIIQGVEPEPMQFTGMMMSLAESTHEGQGYYDPKLGRAVRMGKITQRLSDPDMLDRGIVGKVYGLGERVSLFPGHRGDVNTQYEDLRITDIGRVSVPVERENAAGEKETELIHYAVAQYQGRMPAGPVNLKSMSKVEATPDPGLSDLLSPQVGSEVNIYLSARNAVQAALTYMPGMTPEQQTAAFGSQLWGQGKTYQEVRDALADTPNIVNQFWSWATKPLSEGGLYYEGPLKMKMDVTSPLYTALESANRIIGTPEQINENMAWVTYQERALVGLGAVQPTASYAWSQTSLNADVASYLKSSEKYGEWANALERAASGRILDIAEAMNVYQVSAKEKGYTYEGKVTKATDIDFNRVAARSMALAEESLGRQLDPEKDKAIMREFYVQAVAEQVKTPIEFQGESNPFLMPSAGAALRLFGNTEIMGQMPDILSGYRDLLQIAELQQGGALADTKKYGERMWEVYGELGEVLSGGAFRRDLMGIPVGGVSVGGRWKTADYLGDDEFHVGRANLIKLLKGLSAKDMDYEELADKIEAGEIEPPRAMFMRFPLTDLSKNIGLVARYTPTPEVDRRLRAAGIELTPEQLAELPNAHGAGVQPFAGGDEDQDPLTLVSTMAYKLNRLGEVIYNTFGLDVMPKEMIRQLALEHPAGEVESKIQKVMDAPKDVADILKWAAASGQYFTTQELQEIYRSTHEAGSYIGVEFGMFHRALPDIVRRQGDDPQGEQLISEISVGYAVTADKRKMEAQWMRLINAYQRDNPAVVGEGVMRTTVRQMTEDIARLPLSPESMARLVTTPDKAGWGEAVKAFGELSSKIDQPKFYGGAKQNLVDRIFEASELSGDPVQYLEQTAIGKTVGGYMARRATAAAGQSNKKGYAPIFDPRDYGGLAKFGDARYAYNEALRKGKMHPKRLAETIEQTIEQGILSPQGEAFLKERAELMGRHEARAPEETFTPREVQEGVVRRPGMESHWGMEISTRGMHKMGVRRVREQLEELYSQGAISAFYPQSGGFEVAVGSREALSRAGATFGNRLAPRISERFNISEADTERMYEERGFRITTDPDTGQLTSRDVRAEERGGPEVGKAERLRHLRRRDEELVGSYFGEFYTGHKQDITREQFVAQQTGGASVPPAEPPVVAASIEPEEPTRSTVAPSAKIPSAAEVSPQVTASAKAAGVPVHQLTPEQEAALDAKVAAIRAGQAAPQAPATGSPYQLTAERREKAVDWFASQPDSGSAKRASMHAALERGFAQGGKLVYGPTAGQEDVELDAYRVLASQGIGKDRNYYEIGEPEKGTATWSAPITELPRPEIASGATPARPTAQVETPSAAEAVQPEAIKEATVAPSSRVPSEPPDLTEQTIKELEAIASGEIPAPKEKLGTVTKGQRRERHVPSQRQPTRASGTSRGAPASGSPSSSGSAPPGGGEPPDKSPPVAPPPPGPDDNNDPRISPNLAATAQFLDTGMVAGQVTLNKHVDRRTGKVTYSGHVFDESSHPQLRPQEASTLAWLEKFSDKLQEATEAVDEHGKATGELTKKQIALYGDIGKLYNEVTQMQQAVTWWGGPGQGLKPEDRQFATQEGGFAHGPTANRITRIKMQLDDFAPKFMERAQQQVIEQRLAEAMEPEPQQPGPWAQSLSRFGQRYTSGWELMRLARMWNLTGGPVFSQMIPAAFQSEMSYQQAASMMGGGLEVGGVGGTILQSQLRRQQARITAGEVGAAAYDGGMPISPVFQQLQGLFGPAVGAGLVGGAVASGAISTLAPGIASLFGGGVTAAGISAAAGPVGIGVGLAAAGSVGQMAISNYTRNVDFGDINNAIRFSALATTPTGERASLEDMARNGGLLQALGNVYTDISRVSRPGDSQTPGLRLMRYAFDKWLGGGEDTDITGDAIREGQRWMDTPLGHVNPRYRASVLYAASEQIQELGGVFGQMTPDSIANLIAGELPYTDVSRIPASSWYDTGQAPEWLTRAASGIRGQDVTQMALAAGQGRDATEMLRSRLSTDAFQRTLQMQGWQMMAPAIAAGALSVEQASGMMGTIGGLVGQERQDAMRMLSGDLRPVYDRYQAQERMQFLTFQAGLGQTQATPESFANYQAVQAYGGVSAQQAYSGLRWQTNAIDSPMPDDIPPSLGGRYNPYTGEHRNEIAMRTIETLMRDLRHEQGDSAFAYQMEGLDRRERTLGINRAFELRSQALQGATMFGGAVEGTEFTGSFAFQRQSLEMGYEHSLRNMALQSAASAENQRWQRLGIDRGFEDLYTGRDRQLISRGWQDEDFARSRERLGAGFEFDRRGLDLQMREAGLRRGWATEDFAYQREMSAMQYGWQMADIDTNMARLSQQRQWSGAAMGLQLQETGMRREWAGADFALQRQVSSMQFGWQMEDYDEAIRFSSGRDRQRLVRQKERQTTMYNIESERADTQEDRQQQLWQLEDERFELQRQQREESLNWQQEDLEKQRDRQTTLFELEQERINKIEARQKELWGIEDERFALQLERMQKNRQWGDEDLQREQERITTRRQWEDEDFGKQIERLNEQRAHVEAIIALHQQQEQEQRTQLDARHKLQMDQLVESESAARINWDLQVERATIAHQTALEDLEAAKTYALKQEDIRKNMETLSERYEDLQKQMKDDFELFENFWKNTLSKLLADRGWGSVTTAFGSVANTNTQNALQKVEQIVQDVVTAQTSGSLSTWERVVGFFKNALSFNNHGGGCP
jgi:hypothetical protein